MLRRHCTLLFSAIFLAWCFADAPDAGAQGSLHPADVAGSFDALSYNVAGLPDPVSASSPARHSGAISPLLNGYDVVLLQEDFSYHERLVERVDHAFRSPPYGLTWGTLVGDGLSRLSRLPFDRYRRERWRVSSGILAGYCDALAAKGFSVATLHVGRGAKIDVYNLHGDAGTGAADRRARRLALEQLSDHIAEHSAGRAVIVGGDFNLAPSDARDAALLRGFSRRSGLTDAARYLGHRDDHVDRFLFRSGAFVELEPVLWSTADEFVGEQGEPLSDHAAIHVRFAWRSRRRAVPLPRRRVLPVRFDDADPGVRAVSERPFVSS